MTKAQRIIVCVSALAVAICIFLSLSAGAKPLTTALLAVGIAMVAVALYAVAPLVSVSRRALKIGALTLVVIGVLALAGIAFNSFRVQLAVGYWVVQTKPVQLSAARSPSVTAGPFESQSGCQTYADLMTRYSHYAVLAKQYGMLPSEPWGAESVEVVESCQTLRGPQRVPYYGFPLGTSLDEARKNLHELFTQMQRCYDEWARFDAFPPDDTRRTEWSEYLATLCSRPPADWNGVGGN